MGIYFSLQISEQLMGMGCGFVFVLFCFLFFSILHNAEHRLFLIKVQHLFVLFMNKQMNVGSRITPGIC